MSRRTANRPGRHSAPNTHARLAEWLTEGRIGRGAIVIGLALGLAIPAIASAAMAASEAAVQATR